MSKADIFADFEKSSAEDWQRMIEKSLKGKAFESLITHTAEDIPILPFYHSTDVEETLFNVPNPTQTENTALAARYWVNQFKINVSDDKKANQEAIKALNTGADGIIFKINKSNPDLNLLLKDIQPEYCSLSFETEKPNYVFIRDYFHFLKAKGFDPGKITGTYLHDFIEQRDAGHYAYSETDFQELGLCIKAAAEYPYFKPFYVSAQLYHNSGANIIHEISATLSKLAEYLDKLTESGMDAEELFRSLCFSFAFGRHYFFEIAKIKAFKTAVLKIAAAYEVQIAAADIAVHAATSKRSKSALDFNVNLLRNSTEAMSAILAGCNSLWVEPHDAVHGKEPRDTFKRIALNVSNILKEEAYLDKIADPTLGTYYLESIIKSMHEKAWEHFIKLEDNANYTELFEQGLITVLINEDEEKSAKAVMQRKDLFIGANVFQLIGEEIPLEALQEDESKDPKYLVPKRATHKIEALRSRTEKYVRQKGELQRPKATLVLLDTDPVSKAKSDFSYSFLGMAGIAIEEEEILKDLAELPAAVKGCPTELLVLCYKEKPEDLSQKLKGASAKVLIAGQEADEEQLKEAGLYGCIHRGVSPLEFLNNLLTDLGIQ